MKKKKFFILIDLSFIVIGYLFISSKQDVANFERWDQKIIREAVIWENLIVNYANGDRANYWPVRKQALINVIDRFPESQWADDAALLLAGGQASFENDLPGAIISIRKIILAYPKENTIIFQWDSNFGCHISDAWFMWAPSLVSKNQNRTVCISFPFDKDGHISLLENEALTYFTHLEKYPQLTKDVAQFIIASMYREQGDIDAAATELENLINAYPDLSVIRAADYEAANNPNGYLLKCEPPFDIMPIWRVQYAASALLIDIYKMQKKNDKAINLTKRLVSSCSSDGWYWNINRCVGDNFAENNEWNLASEQYSLALMGIQRIAKDQAARKDTLFKLGNIIKPNDFVSWEDESLKFYSSTIDKTAELLRIARSH